MVSHKEIVDSWYKADKEENLRFNYDLKPDSVVFDVGAYDGKWAKNLHEQHGCIIHAFEPVSFANKMARQTLAGLENVFVHDFGFGPRNERLPIFLNKDGSSLLYVTNITEMVQLRTAKNTMEMLGVNRVDLIKFNIEGAEYDVLENIIDDGILNKFTHIQIQFHRELPRYTERRDNIRKELSKTHLVTYDFPFVWESWSLKERKNG